MVKVSVFKHVMLVEPRVGITKHGLRLKNMKLVMPRLGLNNDGLRLNKNKNMRLGSSREKLMP